MFDYSDDEDYYGAGHVDNEWEDLYDPDLEEDSDTETDDLYLML